MMLRDRCSNALNNSLNISQKYSIIELYHWSCDLLVEFLKGNYFYTPLTKYCTGYSNMAATVSNFYQKHKLQSLLLITCRPLDLEIGRKIRREVLTTFFEHKNKLINLYFHFWLVRESMVKKENYHTKSDSLYKFWDKTAIHFLKLLKLLDADILRA